MAAVPAIQTRIDELQNSFHDKVDDVMSERDLKRNDIYAARTKVLKEKGPKNFWALVIQSHEDVAMELMGPYDATILDSLEDLNVEFTQDGYKLTIKFGRNDFFEEKELWAEDVDGDMKFSGISWKDGKGPLTEAEEEQASASKSGTKRERDDRGPSLFEVFAEMAPHPEEDEELEEEDDEEIEELVGEWEEDLEDRKEVLGCLVDEIWADPASVLAKLPTGKCAEGCTHSHH
ncbi:Hypothetical protein, putative [Bodo saltans]|uniref:Nucleosome assembly protein n=1 Tax=Bodo saltans TaxID=75058 RepID=A0A0S4J5N0_BODSA|nr:Hypothetical protein, putative [Bodo saltans]|eukprot:CUG85455.1 Hypothetical protein, putative [Bodo saltans]